MAQAKPTQSKPWQAVISSDDREAFQQMVQPHVEAMIEAARDDLRFYVAQGRLHERDLSPEEVTGEALLQAWAHRKQRPERMSLRGWLLGTQYRVLRGLVEQQHRYRQDKAISLDEPLPPGPAPYDTQEWFWEWYQPDANHIWEDVIPAREPVDIEMPLYGSRELLHLEAPLRHVLMMHDEFEMSLSEIAFTMNQAVNETAELLDQARATLRERLSTSDAYEETDHPAPPEGSDE